MGKRELLLAGVFILLGVVVYQLTAPPADPATPGFSLSRLIDEVRREIRGQRESAEETRTVKVPVSRDVQEVRIGLEGGSITITGEDRDDIAADLHVRSSGYDKPEAERLVKATQLKVDEAGAVVIMNVSFPREGRQTATLTLRVPKRLGIRMESKGGALKVKDVASVTIGSARGETTLQNVSGEVSLTQRGRTLTIDGAGSVRLNVQGGAEVRLANVRGGTNLTMQGGELRAQDLQGELQVESRNAELVFERLQHLNGPIRMNLVGGEMDLTGLAAEARIDGRESEIRVAQASSAPLAIYNTGGPIELIVPPGGFTLDARATDGRISVEPPLAAVLPAPDAPEKNGASDGPGEQRISSDVRGGGAVVTLRNTRGEIVLRAK